jgi:chromosome segregation ATPase
LALEDVCAVVAWSAGTIATSTALADLATAYGRPAVAIASIPVGEFAEAFRDAGGGDKDTLVHLRGQIDAHFDAIAALVTDVEATDPGSRKVRSLTARLATQEAAASARERELEELLAQVTRRITENDIRFTKLWRKIRECDKHYNWQFNRAETAEERLRSLEEEVEWLRAHQRGTSRARQAYLAVRRLVGALLRRLGLRPPLAPPPSDET